ncbi:MAG: 2Fe-2S iron-sulfur cluster-binding protein [Planctomycetota bacterium]|jgi:ferredoxin
MPKLTIDGREIEVGRGATILDAAEDLGISIPTLCHGKGLPPVSSCMLCAGKDRRGDRILPSCEAKALDGMEIDASGDEVVALRREAVGLLIREHAGDCEAPCQTACPAGMAIPAMMRLIREEKYGEALAWTRKSLPFPGVLGRICSAPCERVCRRSLAEGSVSIRRLHGFLARWDAGSEKPNLPPVEPITGKSVAIVGAGPAGLSAAWFLLQAGHEVRAYEMSDFLGGWLRTGLSSDELPPSVIDGDLAQFVKLGARFHLGKQLGRNVTLDDLAAESDAVLLAMGKPPAAGLESLGLKVSATGIAVEGTTSKTDRPGVFATGDVVKAGTLLVRTVAQARAAALSIGRFLSGVEGEDARSPFQSRLGRLGPTEAEAFLDGLGNVRGIDCEQKSPPDADEVPAEARRCLQCDCRSAEDCWLRSLAGNLSIRSGGSLQGERKPYTKVLQFGNVSLDQGKCILCGLCVRSAEAAGEKVGLAFKGRGARTAVSPPLKEARNSVLETSAEACVEACPTGALFFHESGRKRHG